MTVYSKINEDLQEERNKVIFSVEEFTNWYHGGSELVQQKRFLGNLSLLSWTFELCSKKVYQNRE